MKTEVIYDMPDAEYHALPYVSASLIKKALRSPAHAWLSLNQKFLPTPAMELGTLIHQAILEPAVFAETVHVTDAERMTKSVKESAPGKKVIKQDLYDSIRGASNAVMTHPIASELLQGHSEFVVLFERNGIRCKAKIDHYCMSAIVDLKTTRDAGATPKNFLGTVIDLDYHTQLAWYKIALAEAEMYCDSVAIIAVETTYPFAVNVFEVDQDLLAIGHRRALRGFETAASVLEMRTLPEVYPARVNVLSPPAWLQKEET